MFDLSIKIKNVDKSIQKKSHKTEPCGTPTKILRYILKISPVLVLCCLVVRFQKLLFQEFSFKKRNFFLNVS